MSPLIAVLLTPYSVSCRTAFGDLSISVTEYHTDVQVWVLLFYEQHLLPVTRIEYPFGLYDDTIGEEEVWGVVPCLGWLFVGNFETLELGIDALSCKGGGEGGFEATAVCVPQVGPGLATKHRGHPKGCGH